MKRYIAHIETNHLRYDYFTELTSSELKNAQTESIESAQDYAYKLNKKVFDRPIFNIFRITIYEKTLDFPKNGIATYQSVSRCISEKFGFHSHYADIVHYSRNQFYKAPY